jgi:RNA polymerase sigma factor (sigma-70 family)
MKYTYTSATGAIEIEVDEAFYDLLVDMDRQDYNTNQRETRRHCSLEAYNLDDALLPSDVDIEGDLISAEQSDKLDAAIATLTPEQQKLIQRVFVEDKKIVDIAHSDGVSEAAVRNRLRKIYARLKKILI